VALARKALRLTQSNDAEAMKIRIMARVFAGEVCQIVTENALRVVTGTAATDPGGVDQFMAAIGAQEMTGSRNGWITDMDKIADIIFER
jgi:alkylation response protein AidB-like acyl-CoA dehydrogenase